MTPPTHYMNRTGLILLKMSGFCVDFIIVDFTPGRRADVGIGPYRVLFYYIGA